MRVCCIHTHTAFCDGAGTVEDFCKAAFEKGLACLGFSAHAPVFRKTGFRTDWHLSEDRIEAYLDAVRAAKKRWEGRLPVYLGLEIDFIEGLMGPADSDYLALGLDYIIGSVHYLLPPRGAPFAVDGPADEFAKGFKEGYNNDRAALTAAYWGALGAMIRAGGFDVLGHADLVKKNLPLPPGEEAAPMRLCEAALDSGGGGFVAEINTGGMNRGKTAEPYPSAFLLPVFLERGIPMMLSADAHRPEDLDGYYSVARQALLGAGYKEAVVFEGRRDGRASWSPEAL